MPPEPSTSSSAILLTGGTGFLGQYVLRDLLLDQKNVIVVAREKRRKTAFERVKSIVDRWKALLSVELSMPEVVSWDIQSSPDCISSSDSNSLCDKVGAVVHTAANVRFTHDEKTNEPFTSNVEGTRNVLSLSKHIGKCDFHHVSTAYVSGFSTGTVLEEPPLNPQFRNVYEESKYLAEQLLRENRSSLRSLTFYRPSIIVGDSSSGFAPSFHTIYLALRLASLLQNSDGYSLSRLLSSMGVSPNISKNLVPVDWVSSSIISLLKTPSARNKIYHLTHDCPLSLDSIMDAMLAAISLEPDHWNYICSNSGSVDSGELTNVFTQSFREYFQDDPLFDRENLLSAFDVHTVPPMSKEVLTRLFRYAIRCSFADSESQSTKSVIEKIFSTDSQEQSTNTTTILIHSRQTQQCVPRKIAGPLALEIMRHQPQGLGPHYTIVSDKAISALEGGQLSCAEALYQSAMLMVPCSSGIKSLLPIASSTTRMQYSDQIGPTMLHDRAHVLPALREATSIEPPMIRAPFTEEQSS